MHCSTSPYFSVVAALCFAFFLSLSVEPVGSQAPTTTASSGGQKPGSGAAAAPAGNAAQGPAQAPPPAAAPAPAPAPAPQQAQLQPILGISGAVEAKLNLTISVGKRRRRQVSA